jgi:hypothetical protein
VVGHQFVVTLTGWLQTYPNPAENDMTLNEAIKSLLLWVGKVSFVYDATFKHLPFGSSIEFT